VHSEQSVNTLIVQIMQNYTKIIILIQTHTLIVKILDINFLKSSKTFPLRYSLSAWWGQVLKLAIFLKIKIQSMPVPFKIIYCRHWPLTLMSGLTYTKHFY